MGKAMRRAPGSRPATRKQTITALMYLRGYSYTRIGAELGISRQRVPQILDIVGEDLRADPEMPDDPRWLRARALLGLARTREDMAAIWEEHRDIWTPELTRYGEARLQAWAVPTWRPPVISSGLSFEQLKQAYREGKFR